MDDVSSTRANDDSRDLLRFLLCAFGLFAAAPAQLALQAGLRHVPAAAAIMRILTEASESSLRIHPLHAPTVTE